MKDLFLLKEDVVFLNHGSFGATPRPVFAVYQDWQRRLEAQPVRFLGREIGDYLAQARAVLAATVHADPDDLVFIPNATFGVNVVARSLELGPGDEVLTTDQEYGACENIWSYLSRKRGFSLVKQEITLPFGSQTEMTEEIWSGVTEKTRVIYMSHITSPMAVRLPVEMICARARAAGILTVIDGAHALGQISLDLAALGADFYTSNGHKWLCSPKGSAFLYARREKQALIEPLVVGWGWEADPTFSYGSPFLDNLQWLGTNDLSAYLAVPAAIGFQEAHDWTAVRARCHELLNQGLARIGALTGLPPAYADDAAYHQMAIAPLPPIDDLLTFKSRLYDEFRIEIPLTESEGRPFIRLSVQGYNDQGDIDALLAALEKMLGQ